MKFVGIRQALSAGLAFVFLALQSQGGRAVNPKQTQALRYVDSWAPLLLQVR